MKYIDPEQIIHTINMVLKLNPLLSDIIRDNQKPKQAIKKAIIYKGKCVKNFSRNFI